MKRPVLSFLAGGLAGLVLLFAVSAAQAQNPRAKPLQYLRVGNPQDVTTKTRPGFALIGGGKDLDEAFRWLCDRSGGGDFLILRATGTDAYNPYVNGLCHQNSVATLIIPSRGAAQDPRAASIIAHAEAIFISGGDQGNYINFWKGTPVQAAINDALQRGVPEGGTSAGLAVQGEFIYSAQNDPPDGPDLTSAAALADPFQHQIVLVRGFLNNPLLADTLTDTHFVTRNRLGRLLTMMARLLNDGTVPAIKAIAIDEQTAVLLDPDGQARVVGKGAAYFLRAGTKPPPLALHHPLDFEGVTSVRLHAGDRFSLSTWKGDAVPYSYGVANGVVRSSLGNSIY